MGLGRLTAREALVAATVGSAFALGLSEHVGTVEAGKLADLIVVEGDPLAEPSCSATATRIWLVSGSASRSPERPLEPAFP